MRMSFKEQVWKFKKQHSVLFAFCTSMHPVEDNIHWISPNPNKIDVFGKKGNGISAALKTAKNYTGEIKIVNEGKWNKGKEIKERRKRKRQGSLPSKEYRTNIKEFKEEIRHCYSHFVVPDMWIYEKTEQKIYHVDNCCHVFALSSHPTPQIPYFLFFSI